MPSDLATTCDRARSKTLRRKASVANVIERAVIRLPKRFLTMTKTAAVQIHVGANGQQLDLTVARYSGYEIFNVALMVAA